MRFGLQVSVHLFILSPILAYEQNLSILLIWGCIFDILEDITTKSSAYTTKLIVIFEVLKIYPRLSLSSHLNSGSKKMKKRYGLRGSVCIVPCCMAIGFAFIKCVPRNVVCELAEILPISWIASNGFPRLAIMASSLA